MKSVSLTILFIFCLFLSYGQDYTGDNQEIKLAISLYRKNKNREVISICNKNIEKSVKSKDSASFAVFTAIKGFIYLDTISQDSARKFFESALEIGIQVQDYNAIHRALYGLGRYYYRNSNFMASNKYLYLLSYYAEKQKNKYYRFVASYYLSANYNLLHSLSRTIHYARIASQLALELQDTTGYIKSIVSIAGRHLLMESLDSASHYYTLAENVYNNYSRKTDGIGADIYNGLLRFNVGIANYDKAIYYGKLAINDAIKSDYEQNLNVYYDNIGLAYAEKKQYDSSIYFLEKSLRIAQKYNYVDQYKADLKELASLYQIKGKNDKAVEYLNKYIRADSMYKSDNSYLIDSLKTSFEAEKADLALKAEKEKLEESFAAKQKNYTLTVILIVLLGFLILFLIYSRYRFKKEKEKQLLFMKVKESEIKALQAQMNPHFIFNSLNSVIEFVRKSRNEEAIAYLTKFTKLIRMVLEYSEKKSILLKDELDFIKLYADLENLRFNNNFACTIHVSPDLDIYTTEIPSMITQPFIENAIIHGLQNKYSILNEKNIKFSGELKIEFSEENGFVKCCIEDNGIGRLKAEEIKDAKLSSHRSMGMRITKDRLSILSERKCEVEFVDLTDNSGNASGTRAIILIPVNNDF